MKILNLISELQHIHDIYGDVEIGVVRMNNDDEENPMVFNDIIGFEALEHVEENVDTVIGIDIKDV